MGVKITKLVEDVKSTPNITKFTGKIIAIDAFNTLYALLSSIRSRDGTSFTNSEGKTTSHLIGLFSRNAYLLENRIRPVYVFDGKAPTLKASTVAKRKEIREAARKKAEVAREEGDILAARKYAQASTKLETYMIAGSKQLLNLMGIPFVQAPGEGEAQAAFMARVKQVHVVSSQDYDCFLFGAPHLLRNLTQQKFRTIQGRRYPIVKEYYSLKRVLEHLGLTQEQLVDLGILVGTDFNDNVPGVGQKTAYKLMKKHGSLKTILEEHPNYQEHLSLELAKQVQDIFLKPEINEGVTVEFGKIDGGGLIDFLCNENDFNVERTTSRVKTLQKNIRKKAQQTLF
ncbi:MAG: flap endonuclease-1 [Promethearchaeota archaeon]